ncbi:MAG TPA: hypothetical protein DC064_01855 [Cyanobacteria bacterium UBA9273]|nr:hypothetical protein [Cyanobacteria bacterium UBA9273]
MLAQISSIQVIERSGIEACIYQVEQGYRVQIQATESEFYWHPGIFWSLEELLAWLNLELATLEASLPLGGEWMMLEGDFEDNEIYRGWFIYKTKREWQGYDPLTNCCYTAPYLKGLKGKINRIEEERASIDAAGNLYR